MEVGARGDTSGMTGSRFDPAPDGHHDDLSLAELDGLTLAVPDDPRELEADRLDWLDEEGAPPVPIPRSPRSTRRPSTRRSRLAITAAIVAGSMVVAVISGALGAFVVPHPTATSPASPLAQVNAQVGQVGGLLPETALMTDGVSIDARSLRPAVIALLPDSCPDCTAWLTDIRRQATEFSMDVTLVVAPEQIQQGLSLVRELGSVGVDLRVDESNTFSDTYGSGARTLILVRDDGVVIDILNNPDIGLRLEAELLPLNSALSGKS